ncbi:hypothetical protein JOC48_004212 [Aquibacillus albus]|uniref:Uncharacterized protein n=1 Tax=Aquibacillus albus TaxID=1168171 RepID=A0ABS2N6Y4_9BACI|nr:hypothetical protein [Aquibacillus albus]
MEYIETKCIARTNAPLTEYGLAHDGREQANGILAAAEALGYSKLEFLQFKRELLERNAETVERQRIVNAGRLLAVSMLKQIKLNKRGRGRTRDTSGLQSS